MVLQTWRIGSLPGYAELLPILWWLHSVLPQFVGNKFGDVLGVEVYTYVRHFDDDQPLLLDKAPFVLVSALNGLKVALHVPELKLAMLNPLMFEAHAEFLTETVKFESMISPLSFEPVKVLSSGK
jgi:hypothetical protein